MRRVLPWLLLLTLPALACGWSYERSLDGDTVEIELSGPEYVKYVLQPEDKREEWRKRERILHPNPTHEPSTSRREQ